MSEPTRRIDAESPDDEFYDYLSAALEDPEYAAVLEDTNELHKVIDGLVAARRSQGLTQKDLAQRMGVSQPTVSGFETEMADPRIGTLQRYARAVGCRLAVSVQVRVTMEAPSPYAGMVSPPDRSAQEVGTAEIRPATWERSIQYSASNFGTAA